MLAAIIKLAFHARWQGAWFRIYLGLMLIYVMISCLILMRYRALLSIVTGVTEQRMLMTFTLVETALVLALAPLLSLNSPVTQDVRRALLPALLSPVRSIVMVMGQLAWPCLLMLATVVASTLPMLLFAGMSEQVSVATVLATRSLLLVFALGGITLGLCSSLLCRDVYSAAAVAYLIIVAVGGSIVLTGPLIARLANAVLMIHLVVWINPFVGMAAALNVDILRIEWLYVLSPLGQRPVVYPAWYGVGLGYLIFSCLLIAVSTWRIASRRCHMDRWPLSSWSA